NRTHRKLEQQGQAPILKSLKIAVVKKISGVLFDFIKKKNYTQSIGLGHNFPSKQHLPIHMVWGLLHIHIQILKNLWKPFTNNNYRNFAIIIVKEIENLMIPSNIYGLVHDQEKVTLFKHHQNYMRRTNRRITLCTTIIVISTMNSNFIIQITIHTKKNHHQQMNNTLNTKLDVIDGHHLLHIKLLKTWKGVTLYIVLEVWRDFFFWIAFMWLHRLHFMPLPIYFHLEPYLCIQSTTHQIFQAIMQDNNKENIENVI
ncbi:hypothetical protein ACJX0J_034304, partial [Zea mays]